MSRGYDGPEIDDFRDPEWGHDRDSSYRDSRPGSGHDWQSRASVRLRLQKLREAESDSDRLNAHSREHLKSSRPRLSPGARELPTLAAHHRARYTDCDRNFSLRPSEIDTLTEVAKFRVVGVEDLATFSYDGDRSRMESDLRNLKEL